MRRRANGERRFVRGVGEQPLLRVHQRLDAAGGRIEGFGEFANLVAPAHRNARLQIALAERSHALLQLFEVSGQPPDKGVGADCDGEGDGEDDAEPAQGGNEEARIGRRPHGHEQAPAVEADYDRTMRMPVHALRRRMAAKPGEPAVRDGARACDNLAASRKQRQIELRAVVPELKLLGERRRTGAAGRRCSATSDMKGDCGPVSSGSLSSWKTQPLKPTRMANSAMLPSTAR